MDYTNIVYTNKREALGKIILDKFQTKKEHLNAFEHFFQEDNGEYVTHYFGSVDVESYFRDLNDRGVMIQMHFTNSLYYLDSVLESFMNYLSFSISHNIKWIAMKVFNRLTLEQDEDIVLLINGIDEVSDLGELFQEYLSQFIHDVFELELHTLFKYRTDNIIRYVKRNNRIHELKLNETIHGYVIRNLRKGIITDKPGYLMLLDDGTPVFIPIAEKFFNKVKENQEVSLDLKMIGADFCLIVTSDHNRAYSKPFSKEKGRGGDNKERYFLQTNINMTNSNENIDSSEVCMEKSTYKSFSDLLNELSVEDIIPSVCTKIPDGKFDEEDEYGQNLFVPGVLGKVQKYEKHTKTPTKKPMDKTKNKQKRGCFSRNNERGNMMAM